MADEYDILGMMDRKPDTKVSLALLLRYLATILESDDDSMEGKIDGIATEPDEIRVRPRIEPLGGS